MNIEARKLVILEQLAKLNDEAIIQQIENLLKPKADFWQELPDSHKQIILKGIKDLDEGRSIPFDIVKAKFNRLNK